MNEDESCIAYRVSFALLDEHGCRQGVALPNAMHLLYQRSTPPLLPRVGERISLTTDLVDFQARSYRVIDVEHGLSSNHGLVLAHHVVIVLRDA